jgi:hypothetical protein
MIETMQQISLLRDQKMPYDSAEASAKLAAVAVRMAV